MEQTTDTMKDARPSGEPIRRIMVAADGSQSADNALQIAARIGEKYSAEIDIMHVNVSHSGERADPNSGEVFEREKPESLTSMSEAGHAAPSGRSSDEELLSERKEPLKARGLRINTISISSTASNVGSEIVRRCNDGEYDLLAVGSRGFGRAKSFFLGSVSKKVVAEAKCSVLVSKVKIDSIKRVLLAYDGSEDSRRAEILVADIAKKFDAIVNVISVISEPMLSSELDLRAAVEGLDVEMKHYSDQAASMLKVEGINSESAKVVGSQKISTAIITEAEEGFYDIVAMGSRGWGRAKSMFLGSVSSGVLDSSKANVLIVK